MKISFILVAGFSKPAGMSPLSEVSQHFLGASLHGYKLNSRK